jgi:hypothetical protein
MFSSLLLCFWCFKNKSNFPICTFNDIKIVQFGLKYEEDMGFEIREGLELFLQKLWDKIL